jgi:hypothetical protein
MKPTAWYDPSNGVVSTDRDCPLFTPLGQVWPLSIKREWVGLTDDQYFALQMKIKKPMTTVQDYIDAMRMVEQALKELNT